RRCHILCLKRNLQEDDGIRDMNFRTIRTSRSSRNTTLLSENRAIVLMTRFFQLLLILVLQISASAESAAPKEPSRLVDYVRPFVGTQGEGNTYPGPSAPFGMIQISPDTDDEPWETASGYEYSDPSIMGFSLAHLSGTGIPDLGDFLFMPQIGNPKLVAGTKADSDSDYRSRYSHDEEEASAGYYKVKLQKSGVTVELTAGERAGMIRMTFPANAEASIL